MRQDWTAAVVGYLCQLKADGRDFDESWELAVRRFPPRGRDLGEARPTLWAAPGDESVVAATRRFCDDAWHGRRPALRHFAVESMRDAVVDAGGEPGRGRSRVWADAA